MAMMVVGVLVDAAVGSSAEHTEPHTDSHTLYSVYSILYTGYTEHTKAHFWKHTNYTQLNTFESTQAQEHTQAHTDSHTVANYIHLKYRERCLLPNTLFKETVYTKHLMCRCVVWMVTHPY